jgi:hypothetical protein
MCMRIPRDIVMVVVTLILNTIIGRIIFVAIITHLLIAGTSAIISLFGRTGSFVGLVVVHTRASSSSVCHSVFAGNIFESGMLK